MHIDSIIAEISGIPHGISIYDDLVEVDTTTIYKMLFKMDVDTVNFDIVDSTTMKFPTDFKVEKLKKMECKSTISVMGLLANKNPNYINGAGILQVRIYSHIGNKYKKIQYAKINLYKMIKKAHLIITDDWNRIILNSGTNPDFPLSNTFCIDENVLVITRDLTLNTLNNNGSLDTWEGDENNDGEVDDDHLFPDIEM